MTEIIKTYQVRILYNSDDWGEWIKFRAIDKKTAAEFAIEQKEWRNTEFPVGSGISESTVQVKSVDETITNFIVSGESRPIYKAKEEK